MPETMFWGTGRRKTSTARVRIAQGAGKILVNSRPFEEYFPIPLTRKIIMQPLTTTENVGKFDVYANIVGGGSSGQAGTFR
ncbi:30S ribosomal protein S9, partial [bacterium CG2_30_54_10]